MNNAVIAEMPAATRGREPLTIRMHESDNVAIVAIVANNGGLSPGAVLSSGLVLRDRIPQGHKVALVDVAADARPMLQLRPNCECCDRDLAPDSTVARICSFECTFCESCASDVLGGRCPNCGGELVARPRRSAKKLARFPASTERVFKPEGCGSVQ